VTVFTSFGVVAADAAEVGGATVVAAATVVVGTARHTAREPERVHTRAPERLPASLTAHDPPAFGVLVAANDGVIAAPEATATTRAAKERRCIWSPEVWQFGVVLQTA
jgi:hypothetical protein